MSWRGENQREIEAEREWKRRPWPERRGELVQRGLFIFAVILFFVFWVAVSLKDYWTAI
jgi:hypothetical protein